MKTNTIATILFLIGTAFMVVMISNYYKPVKDEFFMNSKVVKVDDHLRKAELIYRDLIDYSDSMINDKFIVPKVGDGYAMNSSQNFYGNELPAILNFLNVALNKYQHKELILKVINNSKYRGESNQYKILYGFLEDYKRELEINGFQY